MRLSFALAFLWMLSTLAGAGMAAGNSDSSTAERDTIPLAVGYDSRAGAVLGTYRPAPPDHSPETITRAANQFLSLLNDAQRESAHYDLNSDERRRWTNSPVRGQAGGVALGDLSDDQVRSFSDLLAAMLSASGYAKVRDVMLGDDLRSTVDGEPNEGVGIEAFRFAVFGEPSATSQWAVQLDGHHVALNITLEGDAYSLSPSFIGTYPQAFTVAGKALRPLATETDLAHDLIGSMTPEQRALAVIADRRGSLRVGASRDGVIPEAVGIPVELLTETQKDVLVTLASQWLDLMPPDVSQVHRQQFIDGLSDTLFAWSGPLAAGSDVSWSIQGPSIVIEYANDERGGSNGSNPVDHVHTVYRDLDREYGGEPRD